MSERNPSSDVEGAMMENRSVPSQDEKTNAVANSEEGKSTSKKDEVEKRSMDNGSGPSPEAKASAVDNAEKKESTNENEKMEQAQKMVNGSGPSSEANTGGMADSDKKNNMGQNDGAGVTITNGLSADNNVPGPEKNENEGKIIEGEKDGGEKMESHEKKHGEGNAAEKEELVKDKEAENMTTVEVEDVKMTDTKVDKEAEVEDAKVLNVGFKDEIGGGEREGNSEGEERECKKMGGHEGEGKGVVDGATKEEKGEHERGKEEEGANEDVKGEYKDKNEVVEEGTKEEGKGGHEGKEEEAKEEKKEGGEGEEAAEEKKEGHEEEAKEEKREVNEGEEEEEANEEKKGGQEGEEEEEAKEEKKGVHEAEQEEEEGATKEEKKGGHDEDVEEMEEEEKEEENDMEEGNSGSLVKEIDEEKEVETSSKKRSRGQKATKKGEGMEGVKKAKLLLTSPVSSSSERPVRERKIVERLVEVIEKDSSREFQVEKGRGTPLKDIPKVASKLAKKKPADIKLIHQTLFGRRGKAVDFKNHILQFSGFVWHESDEKQRAKMKEKLDKFVKDTLLDLCDLFDLSISRANARKEDLVTKLLDFLVAPHSMADAIHSEEKSTKSRKLKRADKGSASKNMKDSSKRFKEVEESEQETDSEDGDGTDQDDDFKNTPYKGKAFGDSEDETNESGSEEDEHNEEDSGKGKQVKKRTPKQKGSQDNDKKVGTSSKKVPTTVTTKSPTKTSSSKRSRDEVDNDGDAKVFSRKKRIVDSPKKKSTPRSGRKEKDTGKKVAKGKGKTEAEHPSKEELRMKICEILKEVDFNTATFTDILKQLAAHYKVDLAPRKASIKLLIQEELTKLAEEDDEDEEEEEEEEEESEKEDSPVPRAKKVKT